MLFCVTPNHWMTSFMNRPRHFFTVYLLWLKNIMCSTDWTNSHTSWDSCTFEHSPGPWNDQHSMFNSNVVNIKPNPKLCFLGGGQNSAKSQLWSMQCKAVLKYIHNLRFIYMQHNLTSNIQYTHYVQYTLDEFTHFSRFLYFSSSF